MTVSFDKDLVRRGPYFPDRSRAGIAAARNLAKWHWAMFGVQYCYWLTRPGDNVKLSKSAIPTFGISFAPADVTKLWRQYVDPTLWADLETYLGRFADGLNACADSTPECRLGCLNTSGKGGTDKVQRGRIIKTFFAAMYPDAAETIKHAEIAAALKVHPSIRLRHCVISDNSPEIYSPSTFVDYGERVGFYDYTKNADRADRALRSWLYGACGNGMPSNYRLVWSVSERDTVDQVRSRSAAGMTQAVVFAVGRHKPLPTAWHGIPVVDGDKSDDRLLDAAGVIIGLRGKGKMERHADFPGMVKRPESVPVVISGRSRA